MNKPNSFRLASHSLATLSLAAALAVSGLSPAQATDSTDTEPPVEATNSSQLQLPPDPENLAPQSEALPVEPPVLDNDTPLAPEHESSATPLPAPIVQEQANGPIPGPVPLLGEAPVAAAAPTTTGGTKRFADVPKGHKFYQPITWMYATGLTTGIKNGSNVIYNPKATLTREAMAAFLYRQAGSPAFKMPSKGFIDIPRGHKFYRPIMWMKQAGLTTGINTPQGKAFKPKTALSREAMAAFLYRAEGSPRVTGQVFPDVPKQHKFHRAITWMKQAGLTTGVKQADGRTLYKPLDRVTREAMAAFLHRQEGSPAFVDSGSLTLTGTSTVGGKVTVKPHGWHPSKITYRYQWRANGKTISGATNSSYVPTSADQGKHLSVRVTGSLAGQGGVSMTIGSMKVAPKPAAKATQKQIEDRVLTLVNKERTSRGHHALAKSNLYHPRARAWSQFLVDTGKYEHSEYEWYAEGGRRIMGLYGENLGVSPRTTLNAADDLVKSWMNSPDHRSALLDPELASASAGVAFHTDPDPTYDPGLIGTFVMSYYFDENETGDPYPFRP